jgi:uncharacterized membrane protein YeaQ/YmgE (transglycosylase-associated protein family)
VKEMVMSILTWIVPGLIVGFIANKLVNKTGEGGLMNIVLGVIGAVLGGELINKFEIAGYDPIQKESQGIGAISKPHLIHLRDAQIYPSGASPGLSEKGVLWRGRLEAVDGFSLGRVSLR